MIFFISSPYAGDINNNIQKARQYCRNAVDAGHIPIAPHLLFPQFMKEDTEREKGLKMETGPAPLRESDPITHYLFFSFQISFSYSRIVRSEEKNPAFAILTSIFFSQAVLSSISFRSFSLVLQ